MANSTGSKPNTENVDNTGDGDDWVLITLKCRFRFATENVSGEEWIRVRRSPSVSMETVRVEIDDCGVITVKDIGPRARVRLSYASQVSIEAASDGSSAGDGQE